MKRTQIICDICGEETSQQYFIYSRNVVGAKARNSSWDGEMALIKGNNSDPKGSIDLCYNCAKKISELINELSH